MTEGVGGNGFVYFGKLGGLAHCFLQAGFVDMMALPDASDRVFGKIGGGEDVLPNPFAVSVGTFFSRA